MIRPGRFANRPRIQGYDYSAQRPVEMTAREWRTRYPASAYRRRVENGETFYQPIPRSPEDRPQIAAEAYANIPEARS